VEIVGLGVDICIQRMERLAANVVRRAEEVFQSAKTPAKPTESYIKVDHDLTTTLTTLLGEAVRLKSLLSERTKNKHQSDAERDIQVRRTRWLRDELLKDVKLSALFDSKVRAASPVPVTIVKVQSDIDLQAARADLVE
jgi:hypothetical protein